MECQRQSSTVLSSAALRASFSLREMIHLGMPTESPFLFLLLLLPFNIYPAPALSIKISWLRSVYCTVCLCVQ